MPRGRRGPIESPDLQALLRDLKGIDKKLATDLRKALRTTAEPTRRAVASEASWSSRIPRAVKVQVKATKRASAVLVVVDRKKAPHARPLEHGSKGNRGTVRHPLFGDRNTFVEQPTRPFFAPAIKRQGGRIDAAVNNAVEAFTRDLGFK